MVTLCLSRKITEEEHQNGLENTIHMNTLVRNKLLELINWQNELPTPNAI